MITVRSLVGRVSLSLLLLAPCAAGAAAQDTDTSAYAVPDFTSGRDASELRADIDRAQVEQNNASRTADRLKDYRERLSARLDVQRADINAFKSRVDLAKKEGRADDRATLETQRKQAELDRKALEELNSLYATEIDESNARRDWARAQTQSYQTELALEAMRRQRWETQTTDTAAVRKIDNDIYDLEAKLLDARRDEASKQANWADKYRRTVDQQASVHRASGAARGLPKR